jgi:hypothetical protein
MWDLATIVHLNEKAHQEYLERKQKKEQQSEEAVEKPKVKVA